MILLYSELNESQKAEAQVIYDKHRHALKIERQPKSIEDIAYAVLERDGTVKGWWKLRKCDQHKNIDRRGGRPSTDLGRIQF